MNGTRKTVSLVLGSGGARGLAHIGVIRWLEENGYSIESVTGSSMGALIGGIYAAGKLDEYVEWVRAVDKIDIIKLLDISLLSGGFVKGDRIINVLREQVGEIDIERLPIPFTAVASDIRAEKEIWINKGPLFDAIRASISIPLFFTPYLHKGVKLIDGGVLNPVPIAPAFNDRTDMIVAVNLGGKPDSRCDKPAIPQPVQSDAFSYYRAKIESLIDVITKSIDFTKDATDTEEWDVYDIAFQSIDAMQGTIARQKLAAYPPDIIIEIPRNACSTLEFDRADEMIALGRLKAQKAFSRYTSQTEL